MRRWWLLVAKRSLYTAMRGAYRFDRWHCRVVRENCRYFEIVRTLHRALNPAATVEIGCGLGEIISGLESPVRVGVDREASVIRAARLLRGRAVTFLRVDELERLKDLLGSTSNTCLLFLNWFHVYRPDELRLIAAEYVRKLNATHVIFDVINEDARGYRFRHTPEVLLGSGSIIAIREAGDGIRRIVALRINYRGEPGRVHDAKGL